MTFSADVRWAYKYYLGRTPENDSTVDFYVEATGGQIDTLRGALFDSDEAQESLRRITPEGEFCIWRPGRPKAVIIGNCIGPNLGRTFAAMTDMSVYAFDILKADLGDGAVMAFVEDADYVLIPKLGSEFGEFSGDKLRCRIGNRVAFYTLVYFAGIHPDITYLGMRGERCQSPLGDYHSRLVLRCFLAGISSTDCRAQFGRMGEEAEAIRTTFSNSIDEYLLRESDSDIQISKWLFEEIRRRPLLYTVNHPTADVLSEIVKASCNWFGLQHARQNSELVSNDLSRDVMWPVHASVAQALELDYSTPDVFWIDRYAQDLDEFVWRSYRLYAGYDQTGMRSMAAERGLLTTSV